MQTEARVGVVVEGGPRALNSQPKQHKPLQQQYQQSQIGTISQLVAGGVAGALSKTCTAPLARLTILFQVQGMHSDVATLRKASIWHEASRVIREEGFRALWKGNLVTIAHRLPYSSVNFYAYERYKQFLHMIPGLEIHRESAGVNLFVHFVGGGLAGITAASATYPLDLVRTRLAAQTNVIYYRGIWHALQTISREEGVFGLYKGLGATLLGVGPSIAINFSVYESLRSFWQSRRPHDSTVAVSLACGSLSGIASSTATFPLDLVRRRKQLEGAGGRAPVYTTGLLGIFKQIIQTEGFRGLYRGIMPEYYKVVPGVSICFTTYETLKLLLADVTPTL
ncbi:PREDICTED: mitochondrial substrate carrier family protein B-like isoform X2 [Populus euphratica]|uniref:Mitochondrial substrate carrier family protein B-like isoform X2 n=1 Tax=Populus euphratica TaxID=75702 RepID=A0AAJ6UW60_POPEU|nr:PREDICTED: mitochondrial substrate carrier family protein B-like isoform X2 [Populus euphratica]